MGIRRTASGPDLSRWCREASSRAVRRIGLAIITLADALDDTPDFTSRRERSRPAEGQGPLTRHHKQVFVGPLRGDRLGGRVVRARAGADPLAWSALQGHSVETAEPNTRRVDTSSRTTNEKDGKW
ncbi:hypothetical protein [Streptomyces sp. NPDC051554]|uniref:hypothetical protein n=1 Tax=Streptomyces sp. NPDC051554 TaxID=3365656 RepID=UPI0037993124